MTTPSRRLLKKISSCWAPPPLISIPQWANANRTLSSESASEPGKWQTLPFQIEPMSSARDNERTVLMFSAQTGKSEILLSVVGYFSQYAPSAIMILQPTISMGIAFSKDRLAPMISNTPALAKLITSNKENSNTVLHKSYKGGHITISGSNSPASLASRPIKILAADECDKYGNTSEGPPLKLAEKRCATFLDRRIIIASTPTIDGSSLIQEEYERSSRAVYKVPCPFCKEFQQLVWENIIYTKDKIENVQYKCEHCSKNIDQRYKDKIVTLGKWEHRNPERKSRGYHLNELVSPWRRWEDICEDFEQCDTEEKLMAWTNTSMGQVYSLPSENAPDWRAIYNRRANYQTVPEGCAFLTSGADIQKDRIEISVLAHCYEKQTRQTYVMDHYVIHGNTAESAPWKELSEYIEQPFKKQSGEKIFLKKVCIDSQYRTTEVLSFCRTQSRTKVVPIRGNANLDTHISIPKKLDIRRSGKTHPSGLKRYNVGVNIIKSDIYARLALTTPTENEKKKAGFPSNYIHFPELEEEYFRQLCAEKAFIEKSKTGKSKYVFKKIYSRNEALDCMTYAFAGYYLLGMHRWGDEKWKKQLLLPSS